MKEMTRCLGFKSVVMGLLLAVLGMAAGLEEAEAYRVVVRQGRTVIHPAPVVMRPGRVVVKLPAGCRRYRHAGVTYYYHGGVYYKVSGKRYVVVKAPLGMVVKTVPAGHTTVVVGGVTYYSYNGAFYRYASRGYLVVAPPQSVDVPISSGSVRVKIMALNVRSGPGLNHAAVGVVGRGTVLPVSGSIPGWLYVTLPDGKTGWVSEQYVAPAGAQPLG